MKYILTIFTSLLLLGCNTDLQEFSGSSQFCKTVGSTLEKLDLTVDVDKVLVVKCKDGSNLVMTIKNKI